MRDIAKQKSKIQRRSPLYIAITATGRGAIGFDDLGQVKQLFDPDRKDMLIINFSVIQKIVDEAISK